MKSNKSTNKAAKASAKSANVTAPAKKGSKLHFLSRRNGANNANNITKKSKKPLIGIISAVCGMAVLVAGAIFVPQWVSPAVEPEPEPEIVAEEEPEPEPEEVPEEEPEEEEPVQPAVATVNSTPNYNYNANNNNPTWIYIPSLGISTSVVQIGKVGGAMGTPNSDYVVGWYNESYRPGEKGASIMTAHGGDLGTGIFKTLPRIADGAKIIITMGNGRQYTYTVVERVWRAEGAESNAYMPTMFQSAASGIPGLNLITCTGTWNRATQSYNQRFFLRAIMQG